MLNPRAEVKPSWKHQSIALVLAAILAIFVLFLDQNQEPQPDQTVASSQALP